MCVACITPLAFSNTAITDLIWLSYTMCTRVIFTALLWEEERKQPTLCQLDDGSTDRTLEFLEGKLDGIGTARHKHCEHRAILMCSRSTEKSECRLMGGK